MELSLEDDIIPHLYVDDLMVLCRPDQVNRVVFDVERFARDNQMELNYGKGKTELINPTKETIYCDVRSVDEYEYLGVTIRVGRGGKLEATFAHAGRRAM